MGDCSNLVTKTLALVALRFALKRPHEDDVLTHDVLGGS